MGIRALSSKLVIKSKTKRKLMEVSHWNPDLNDFEVIDKHFKTMGIYNMVEYASLIKNYGL